MKRRKVWGILVLFIVVLVGCVEEEIPVEEEVPTEEKELSIIAEYAKDIIPVYAKFCEELGTPTISFQLSNPTESATTLKLSAMVSGWSDLTIKNIDLDVGESKIVDLCLTFDETRMMENTEKQKATLFFSVEEDGNVIWEQTESVWVHARDEMIWSMYKQYDSADLISAWVTPRHPAIRDVLSFAKERMEDRTLIGCQSGMDKQRMYDELKAIYDELTEGYRLSYVSVTISYAPWDSQRVSLPRDSLRRGSFNCIDGAVLFASLMEALDIKPYIALVPGHAFVCGYCKHADTMYCIETTFMGTADFSSAISSGSKQYDENKAKGTLTTVDVSEMRGKGITPLE